VRDEEPAADESVFFGALVERIPALQDWYYRDDDGRMWMIVSWDIAPDGQRITETWRCDFDGRRLLGGRSPGFLNWDDGVPAVAAGIDVDGARGLKVDVTDPLHAADIAAAWFKARIAEAKT
jgi:hypothetical protein